MTKYKVNNKVRALVESPRTIHSKKPNEVRNRITDLFGDVHKIELFAREKVNGWDCWGDQAP
jgi:site-specific DNA-methyltransferase (adenine-specific)